MSQSTTKYNRNRILIEKCRKPKAKKSSKSTTLATKIIFTYFLYQTLLKTVLFKPRISSFHVNAIIDSLPIPNCEQKIDWLVLVLCCDGNEPWKSCTPAHGTVIDSVEKMLSFHFFFQFRFFQFFFSFFLFSYTFATAEGTIVTDVACWLKHKKANMEPNGGHIPENTQLRVWFMHNSRNYKIRFHEPPDLTLNPNLENPSAGTGRIIFQPDLQKTATEYKHLIYDSLALITFPISLIPPGTTHPPYATVATEATGEVFLTCCVLTKIWSNGWNMISQKL